MPLSEYAVNFNIYYLINTPRGINRVRSIMGKIKNIRKLDSTLNSWPPHGVWAYLEPSWRAMLGKAFTAVNRPTLCRLEGNLALLTTIRADDLCHLTRAAVVSTAPISITQYFHSYSVCMLRTPHGIPRTLHTQARSSHLNHFTHRARGMSSVLSFAKGVITTLYFHEYQLEIPIWIKSSLAYPLK